MNDSSAIQRRTRDWYQRALDVIEDDFGPGLPLKMAGIAALALLMFGLSMHTLLAFVLGMSIWLTARSVRLTLVQAEQHAALKLHVTRMEHRIRDLESIALKMPSPAEIAREEA